MPNKLSFALTPGILLAVVCTATFFYARRVSGIATQIDLLQSSLAPVRKIVPLKERIWFVADPFNPTLFPQSQYAPVPHLVSPKDSTHNTWLLYVTSPGKTSRRAVDTAAEIIYWQQKDSLYQYCLTRKKDSRPR